MSNFIKIIDLRSKHIKMYFGIGLTFFIVLCHINIAVGFTNKNKYLVNHIGPVNAEVFITSDKNMGIEKIMDPAFQTQFAPIQEGQLTSLEKIYWYKLNFASYDLSVPDIWLLRFQNYDEITIYYREDTKNSVQIKQKILYKRSDEFHFAEDFLFKERQLLPGNLLFARVKQTSKPVLLSDVVCQNAYKSYYNQEYYPTDVFHLEIFYYIFNGGILFMIFYFMGIYFMHKDKLFLLYVWYLLSLLFYLGFKAYFLHWQLIKLIPGFYSIFHDLIQGFVNIFYLLFASVFLKARTDFPKLHIAIRYMVRVLLVIMVLQMIVILSERFGNFDFYIINFERYFVIAFSLFAYFHIIKNYKDPIVLFLLIGSFFYLVGGLCALLFKEVGFMMLGAAIEVFVFSLGMGYRVKKVEKTRQTLENEMNKLRLTALRLQMNPHFIFNSLNSIRAYIITNETKKASDYLNKFARLIRLILHYSSKDTISLKEELEALSLYIELEQMRYRDDFGFELNVAPGFDAEKCFLPPLILQPYVENAIGHGLAPKKGNKKLLVEVAIANGKFLFTIRDNGVGRNYSKTINTLKNPEHKSVAIELTRKRIDLAGESTNGNENIKIIDLEEAGKPAGTEVRLMIPIKSE